MSLYERIMTLLGFQSKTQVDIACRKAVSEASSSLKRLGRIEYYDELKMQKLESLVGKLVISIPNEVDNLCVYRDVRIEYVSKANSPILIGTDVISGKEYMLLGHTELFSPSKFKAYNKLTPHERMLLVHTYLDEEDINNKVLLEGKEPLVNPTLWERQIFTALGLTSIESKDVEVINDTQYRVLAEYSVKGEDLLVVEDHNGIKHVMTSEGDVRQPDHDAEGIIRYLAHVIVALDYVANIKTAK